ncbi:hypothetical protein BFJ67_g17517 [Fusarium oxysporum f. sp. cepae]|nr:hypothetical protein BFJ67_g17517 [Fusarium oxysporum f. sp. cepae]
MVQNTLLSKYHNMCPIQHTFPDQLPPNGDYHTLLHTQIYDYFLSVGMFSCGQALLNSDCNLRHEVMDYAGQQSTTGLHDATPSLLDSGFGSPHSSPSEQPYLVVPEDRSRPQTESALLYQWFCTFWDTFSSTQNGAAGIPMQNCLNFPPNLSQDPFESQPMIWQDSLEFQSCPDVFNPLPLESQPTTREQDYQYKSDFPFQLPPSFILKSNEWEQDPGLDGYCAAQEREEHVKSDMVFAVHRKAWGQSNYRGRTAFREYQEREMEREMERAKKRERTGYGVPYKNNRMPRLNPNHKNEMSNKMTTSSPLTMITERPDLGPIQRDSTIGFAGGGTRTRTATSS